MISSFCQQNTVFCSIRKEVPMDFRMFQDTIMEKTEPTEGMRYNIAMFWVHPYHLPKRITDMGTASGNIIRIPDLCENVHKVDEAEEHLTVAVTMLESSVFQNHTEITDIILPVFLDKICGKAFSGCSSLKRILIPKGVTLIPEGCFDGCDNLEDIYYEGSEEEWNKIRIVHEAYRPVPGQKNGLHLEMETYPVSGNEAVFRARVHFDCVRSKPYTKVIHRRMDGKV